MAEKRSGIEQLIDAVDAVRGTAGLLLFVGIGVAAIVSGGWAGWLVGVAFFVAVVFLAVAWRRRHRV